MSEYTPSTADMKRVYEEQFNLYYAEEVRAKEHAKEFDRWLAKHEAEVARAERERIVELLRSKVKTVNMDWINWIIELIKGENE
jgi:hypothetical protein